MRKHGALNPMIRSRDFKRESNNACRVHSPITALSRSCGCFLLGSLSWFSTTSKAFGSGPVRMKCSRNLREESSLSSEMWCFAKAVALLEHTPSPQSGGSAYPQDATVRSSNQTVLAGVQTLRPPEFQRHIRRCSGWLGWPVQPFPACPAVRHKKPL